MKLSTQWSIIALLESCNHRMFISTLRAQKCLLNPLHDHLSCYLLHVHLSCFTFIDGSLYSDMMLDAFMLANISLLHASMVAHM